MACFFDTNILLYSIGTDPSENAKRDIARTLLDRDDGALSIQVLQEFYIQATRSTRADKLSADIVISLIHTWRRFRVQPITLEVFDAAMAVKKRYGFSYWDSAIVAAAAALDCTELYSEDMSHGQQVAGVTILNPFQN